MSEQVDKQCENCAEMMKSVLSNNRQRHILATGHALYQACSLLLLTQGGVITIGGREIETAAALYEALRKHNLAFVDNGAIKALTETEHDREFIEAVLEENLGGISSKEASLKVALASAAFGRYSFALRCTLDDLAKNNIDAASLQEKLTKLSKEMKESEEMLMEKWVKWRGQ